LHLCITEVISHRIKNFQVGFSNNSFIKCRAAKDDSNAFLIFSLPLNDVSFFLAVNKTARNWLPSFLPWPNSQTSAIPTWFVVRFQVTRYWYNRALAPGNGFLIVYSASWRLDYCFRKRTFSFCLVLEAFLCNLLDNPSFSSHLIGS